MLRNTLVALAATIGLFAGWAPRAALAQLGTAFTYQGQLGNSGAPVSGNVDLQFQLFTAATAGTTVGTLATNLDVPVSNGLFTTSVDAGVNPYTSFQPLFLQIAVRNPAGAGPYVNMTARQPITATPFSLATRGLNVDSAGKVGIGTATPATTLDVRSAGAAVTIGTLSNTEGALYLGNPSHGLIRNWTNISNDIGLFTTGGDVNISASGPNVGSGATIVLKPSGNVGLGDDNPTERLDVVGNIRGRGNIYASGCIIGSNIACPSSARHKDNIEPMGDALEKVTSLNAVRFDWKADEAKVRGFTHDLGFIAEDVAKVFPEVVFRDDKGEVMGLDYARMSAVAVGAIKQLKAENDNLKARLEKIEALLAAQAAVTK